VLSTIVCIKQVPDTVDFDVDPSTGALVQGDVPFVMNPFDLHAVEEAVRIKERLGWRVKAVTMGPPQAEAVLRDALALGADEAFLLSDKDFEDSDTLATSYALTCGIRKMGDFALVICGPQSTDGGTGQVGPELAQELAIPQITYVNRIVELDDHRIRAERLVEDGVEVIESSLPCLITVVKGINQPRLPTFKAKLNARKTVITKWGSKDLDGDESRFGLSGSPTRVLKLAKPVRPTLGEILEGSADEVAEKLVKKLRDLRFI